ncbi:hypothetical protein EJ02DRAFT_452627 [Clathrospora elynae]|uniref:Uncharacterized protein n=1 Tax=Clathrospora elynae TaxID=706981 RepID=A0A6A5SY11_9PLEO|nr:hypothetical protein EJ02DRAFT_452627 [Clathrospora elynae]
MLLAANSTFSLVPAANYTMPVTNTDPWRPTVDTYTNIAIGMIGITIAILQLLLGDRIARGIHCEFGRDSDVDG